MIRLTVRAAAEADIQDACRWYSRQDGDLVDQFVAELRAALRRVREMPRQFPDVGGARRALLHRFSFAAYFVLRDEDHAVVVAVLRHSREPATWRKRIKSENVG